MSGMSVERLCAEWGVFADRGIDSNIVMREVAPQEGITVTYQKNHRYGSSEGANERLKLCLIKWMQLTETSCIERFSSEDHIESAVKLFSVFRGALHNFPILRGISSWNPEDSNSKSQIYNLAIEKGSELNRKLIEQLVLTLKQNKILVVHMEEEENLGDDFLKVIRDLKDKLDLHVKGLSSTETCLRENNSPLSKRLLIQEQRKKHEELLSFLVVFQNQCTLSIDWALQLPHAKTFFESFVELALEFKEIKNIHNLMLICEDPIIHELQQSKEAFSFKKELYQLATCLPAFLKEDCDEIKYFISLLSIAHRVA